MRTLGGSRDKRVKRVVGDLGIRLPAVNKERRSVSTIPKPTPRRTFNRNYQRTKEAYKVRIYCGIITKKFSETQGVP